MNTHRPEMRRRRGGTLARTILWSAPIGIALAPGAQASPLQGVERRWGGETRQVFELTSGTAKHVWTVGDGGHIRHAVNPQTGDDWTVQSPPAGVTQTLLDVHFLDEDHGWACGAAGEVIHTSNGGATWSAFDTGRVQNGLNEDALLWRVRFTDYPAYTQQPTDPIGFTCGLWTFKYWDGTAWQDVILNQGATDENVIEFYALDFVFNPSNPAEWYGVAAGEEWTTAGGINGVGKVGRVYFTSSRAQDAATYDYGRKWVLKHSTFLANDLTNDPWDFEFAPNPNSLDNAVGYLSSGTGTSFGAVFRTANGGQTWSTDLESSSASENVHTLYGITAIDNRQALAVGYGGHIWYRNSSGVWSEMGDNSGCSGPCEWTGPLAGVNAAADGSVYAVGSWGFLHKGSNDWSTHGDLNTYTYQSTPAPRFSESMDEHWRLEASYFLDSDNGFAVGARKTIAESSTGGNDFDPVIGGPLSGVNALFFDLDFNPAGTAGVAVGETEDPLLGSLTLATALSYYYDSSTGSWQAGSHPPSLVNQGFTAIELRGVAFRTNTSSSTEVWAVGTAYDSQDQQPLLLRSTDGGQTWDDENQTAALGTIPNGVILTGVDFATTFGFCVGYDADTGAARAYGFRDPGTGVLIYPLSPTNGGPLRAVATKVVNNVATTYAVGDDEQILKFVPGMSMFEDAGAPTLLGGLDLLSADIAANGFLLVGAKQEYQEPLSLHMGKLIYYDGSNWGTCPSGTNKNVRSVFLRDDDEGWIVSLGDGEPEFGVVGESVVGHFSGIP